MLGGKGNAHGCPPLCREEERIQQVQRDVPTEALLGHVDGRLGPDGVVELTGGERGKQKRNDGLEYWCQRLPRTGALSTSGSFAKMC